MMTLDLGKKHVPKRRETDIFKLHQNKIFEIVLKHMISDKVNPDYCKKNYNRRDKGFRQQQYNQVELVLLDTLPKNNRQPFFIFQKNCVKSELLSPRTDFGVDNRWIEIQILASPPTADSRRPPPP